MTERDTRTMKLGIVPLDDGLRIGLQQELHGQYVVKAYQGSRYIALVVADLSEKESKELAERIALPLSEHVRRVEKNLLPPDSPEAY